ncbi:type II toxin-antitoxin system RelE/ParE family toxin [Rhodopirellula sp. JC639]|uniref:type II toxin-antitoxin system RelE/ParE family toxin n=1 Tax=Stieleria mannarensis TaxID=2755585 RepID=UPI0015FFB81C|nr:type II toxin-antitoxin system RelE/ParE family toxin [Rhodopirellula sp. JC639]
MNVEVLDEARLDIAEGVAFYDHQSDGAGDYFFERIFDDIDALKDTAGVHETHFGFHRKIASRHPYLIYYRIIGTGVEVVAVLDGRGRPSDMEGILRRR